MPRLPSGSLNSIELDPTAVVEMDEEELEELYFLWSFWGRKQQRAPDGDWVTW